jgi:hypothetical protein
VVTHFYPPPPVISRIADTLISSPAVFYQWLLNGSPITGATAQKFVPSQNGSYTVSVSDTSGCATPSAAFSFFLSTIPGNVHDADFGVYPNPTSGVINIKSASYGRLRVTSVQGRYVAEYEMKPGYTIVQLPGGLVPGVYVLNFISQGKVSITKMISLTSQP